MTREDNIKLASILRNPSIAPHEINVEGINRNWTTHGIRDFNLSVVQSPKGFVFVMMLAPKEMSDFYFYAASSLESDGMPIVTSISKEVYDELLKFPQYSPSSSTDFDLDEIAKAEDLINQLGAI